jgi:hypothetical protein
MDRFLSASAKLCVLLGVLPRAEIRHLYVWKATVAVAARVNGKPLTARMVDDWCFWELRYAYAGYRPFSIDALITAFVGHECLHNPALHELRFPGETAILHANRFRHNFREGASL